MNTDRTITQLSHARGSTRCIRPVHLAIWLLLLIGSSMSAALASEQEPASGETLAEVGADREPAKSTNVCNAEGNHCTGFWADMIDHLFTNVGGSTNIYVAAGLEAELVDKAFCVLNQGKFILVNSTGGGERAVLDQLNLSYALNSRFTLRLMSDPTTNECSVMYVRTLYNGS